MDKYEQLKTALRHIGVTIPVPTSASWPVWEDGYLKMMGGPHFDRVATDQVELWLHRLGFHYARSRDRAISGIEPSAVALIDRLWGLSEDGEIEHQLDPDAPYLYASVGYVVFLGGSKAARQKAFFALCDWLRNHGLPVVEPQGPQGEEALELSPPVLRRVAVEWLGHRPSARAWAAPVVEAASAV